MCVGGGRSSTATAQIHLLAASSGPYQVLQPVWGNSVGFSAQVQPAPKLLEDRVNTFHVNPELQQRWKDGGRRGSPGKSISARSGRGSGIWPVTWDRGLGGTLASGTVEVGWSRNTGWLLVANVTKLQSAFLSSVGGQGSPNSVRFHHKGALVSPHPPQRPAPPNSSCLGPPTPQRDQEASCVVRASVAFPKVLPQAPSNLPNSGPSVEIPPCGSVLLPGPCRPSLISDSDEGRLWGAPGKSSGSARHDQNTIFRRWWLSSGSSRQSLHRMA